MRNIVMTRTSRWTAWSRTRRRGGLPARRLVQRVPAPTTEAWAEVEYEEALRA